MADFRCARCEIEWYYITEKRHTDPDYAALAAAGRTIKAAEVIYEGTGLCVEHMIGRIRLKLKDAPLEYLDG